MDRQCRRNRRKREQAQMAIEIKTYSAKPSQVEAVQITKDNMDEVAKWCDGEIRSINRRVDNSEKYIEVNVYQPLNKNQTMGRIGNWILKKGVSFKVYTDRAFKNGYVDVETVLQTPSGTMEVPAAIFESMVEALEKPKETTVRVGANEMTFSTPPAGVPMRAPEDRQTVSEVPMRTFPNISHLDNGPEDFSKSVPGIPNPEDSKFFSEFTYAPPPVKTGFERPEV